MSPVRRRCQPGRVRRRPISRGGYVSPTAGAHPRRVAAGKPLLRHTGHARWEKRFPQARPADVPRLLTRGPALPPALSPSDARCAARCPRGLSSLLCPPGPRTPRRLALSASAAPTDSISLRRGQPQCCARRPGPINVRETLPPGVRPPASAAADSAPCPRRQLVEHPFSPTPRQAVGKWFAHARRPPARRCRRPPL